MSTFSERFGDSAVPVLFEQFGTIVAFTSSTVSGLVSAVIGPIALQERPNQSGHALSSPERTVTFKISEVGTNVLNAQVTINSELWRVCEVKKTTETTIVVVVKRTIETGTARPRN